MGKRFTILAWLLVVIGTAKAEEPFRLNEALDLPVWLSASGEIRSRLEGLDGQFRAGGSGGDQLFSMRSLLHVEARRGVFAVGFELQDSRTYLDNADTPLTRSFVNPLDFIQLYTRLEMDNLFATGLRANLKVGRQVPSIGSRRQVERVDYANVIRSYTGIYLETVSPRGDEFHGFYGVPVSREPADRAGRDANRLVADKEEWGRRFWFAHYRRPDFMPGLVSDLWGELFVYGLFERDRAGEPTPNRRYVWPGFRLFRAKSRGQWDVDIEGAWRVGSRRATSDPQDTRDLDSSSTMLLAKFGYTFDTALNFNMAAQYYRTSGDKDPTDDNFDQFERLFGGRRGDLNHTSIYGPLTPANLTAVGARFEVKPNDRLDARLTWSASYLASATDAWIIARLRDPTGQSGKFIGHTIDGHARYWIVPGNLQLEVGGAALLFGGFTKNVPNGPSGSRSLYGYTQLTIFF